MKSVLRSLGIVFALAALAACTPIRPKGVLAHSHTDERFDFRGTWEGTLGGYNAPHYADSAGFPREFRFVVGTWRVHVYQKVKSAWKEMKPGSFHMRNKGPHAFIYSTDAGQDEDGVWVESWTFTLARRSPTEAVAYWQRTVNNLDIPPNAEWYQFGWGYSGVMYRVSDGS